MRTVIYTIGLILMSLGAVSALSVENLVGATAWLAATCAFALAWAFHIQLDEADHGRE